MTEKQNSNANPTGMGDFFTGPQPAGVKPEDIIKYQTFDSAYTSRFTISRLFSVKKKKFIRPCHVPKFWLEYCLLPGTYVKISTYHHKGEEILTWGITLFKLYRDQDGKVKEEIIKESQWITPLDENRRTVPILRDIENPSFHWHSKVNYDHIYEEEEVNQLLQGGVDPAVQQEYGE